MDGKIYTLNIAHLYPKLLNMYGDWGNVLTLQKRCEWRGINVNIDSIDIGDSIDIDKYDLYFLGGGQDKQQIVVAEELQKYKNELLTAVENNIVFLAICGGYQLLGHYYQPSNTEKIVGIGVFDAYTVASESRLIGNVTSECNFIEPNTLVGFENHSGLTYIQGNTEPLATIKVGKGNNGVDGTEGARYKNAFGTYLHGSFLPKNPHFTDCLISLALQRKYGANVDLISLDDSFELSAHASVINKKY